MDSWDAYRTNGVTFPGEPRPSDVARERQLRRNADGSLRIDPYRNGAAGSAFGDVPATDRENLRIEEPR